MDQRLMLAILLSMVVLLGYYLLFPPPAKPPEPKPAQQTEEQQGQPGQPTAQEAAQPKAGTPAASQPAPEAAGQPEAAVQPATTAAAPAPAPGSGTAVARTVTVDTPLYTVRVDTRGGVVTEFRLKRYKVDKENIDWADVIPPLRRWIKKPDIHPDALENMSPPSLEDNHELGIRFVGEESLSRTLGNTVYQANRDAVYVERGDDGRNTLVLQGRLPDGLTIEKRLTFHPDSYIVNYTLAVANHGEQPRTLRVAAMFGEGPQGARLPAARRSHTGPIWRADNDLKTEDADDVGAGLIVREPTWVGITDNYFLTAAQPETPVNHAFYEAKQVVPPGTESIWLAGYGMELPQVTLAPGKMTTGQFKLYLGPKRVSEMEKFGSKLETSLDLTLDILARPMLAMMRWFHSYTGNYGVAIFLLTVVVRVVLFPLTYRGMLSIKRMQRVQPRMTALKEKFKNDKERLNKEMMGLYRKHKVNPLGGCLPIALQIPIFFALYSALLGAIELRHEPFVFWITDLSAKDGLYVTPVLMGVSMLLQQRLSPTAMDPTQAKIMMWMPLVFAAFMLQFPSGLVVYWLTSNTLSILQQVLINRIKVPELQE